MDDLAALGLTARTNLNLLALLILDITPVAALKTERAFSFIKKLLQHLPALPDDEECSAQWIYKLKSRLAFL